jgi:hypothetical protein
VETVESAKREQPSAMTTAVGASGRIVERRADPYVLADELAR